MKGPDWTSDEIQTARRMWADGKSATEISAVLAGRTRNAVLGFIDRHRDVFGMRNAESVRATHSRQVVTAMARVRGERGIPAKPETVKSHRPKGSPRIASPAPMVMKPTLAEPIESAALPHGWERAGGAHRDLSRFVVPDVEPVRIDQVGRGQCRFTLAGFHADDGGATQCCGAPALAGKSWCSDHMKLVWSKRQPKPIAERDGKARMGLWA